MGINILTTDKALLVVDVQNGVVDWSQPTSAGSDDVLERIKPDDLNQIVAAWTASLWMIAGTDITFKRPEAKPAA